MEALVWETAEELDKNWQNVCAVFADGEKVSQQKLSDMSGE